nr:hypothetical protein [Actinomycetales bacterium]
MSNTTGRRKALSLIAAGALALAGLGAATIPALAENDEGVAVDVATAP